MDPIEQTATGSFPGQVPHLRPHSIHYYLNFGKSRKTIGALATKGYFQVIDLLSRDIPLSAAHNIPGGAMNILTKPFSRADDRIQPGQTPQKDSSAAKNDDIESIVKRSNEVLAEASTVFPFTLFPDTVTVDRTKLTITQRTFFLSSHVITIHIEDVLNVAAHVGPLFGSLIIAIKGLTSEDHFRINFFWRKDAIHLKHVIQGHIIAQHDKLDYRHMEHKKLLDTLIGLGSDSNK